MRDPQRRNSKKPFRFRPFASSQRILDPLQSVAWIVIAMQQHRRHQQRAGEHGADF